MSVDMRAVSPLWRTAFTYVVIVVVSILIGCVAYEVFVRIKIQRQYLSGRYPIIVYSEPIYDDKMLSTDGRYSDRFQNRPADERAQPEMYLGLFNRNRTVTLWFYDAEQLLQQEVNFKINNLGFLSHKDYTVARQAPEYRIAILGDSVTGTTTMDHPWVDRVEDILNADRELLGRVGRQFRVYNFGQPGAGFSQFAMNYRFQAKPFDPDMVIVNYIESDFPRIDHQESHSPDQHKPLFGYVGYRVGDGENDVARLMVTCERPPISLSNLDCRQKFGFYAPRHVVTNKAIMSDLKVKIVRDYLAGQLWTSLYPYGLMAAFGKSVSLSEFRNHKVFYAVTENDMIVYARKSLREIIDDHPNVLVTLHPLYWDWYPAPEYPATADYHLTHRLMSADQKIQVAVMRDRMPHEVSQAEVRDWYNLPHDGHMSKAGGEVYAHAMAALIKERVITRKFNATASVYGRK